MEPDTICIGATPRKGAIVPHKGKACAKQTRTQTFRVALRADVDQVIAQLPNGMLFGLRCEVAPPGLALTWYIKADIGATAAVFVHIDGRYPSRLTKPRQTLNVTKLTSWPLTALLTYRQSSTRQS